MAQREVGAHRITHHLKEAAKHHRAARDLHFRLAQEAIVNLVRDMPQPPPPFAEETPAGTDGQGSDLTTVEPGSTIR